MPMIGDLRVWHIPQVPMEPFYAVVLSPKEAVIILDVLARYDAFQYDHNIKPDYCNAAGLEVYAEEGSEDGKSPGWVEWECRETFMNIDEWATQQED